MRRKAEQRQTGVFESVKLTLNSALNTSVPPITALLIAATSLMYLRDRRLGYDWTDFCVPLSFGVIEFIPSFSDSRVLLHFLSESSLSKLIFQSLSLWIIGAHYERYIGSLRYLLLILSSELLTSWISLATKTSQCYTSESLGPALAAIAVLLHVQNPRAFLPHGSSAEPRWLVWFLIFSHSWSCQPAELGQYLIGILIGLCYTIGYHHSRNLLHILTYHKSRILLAIALFSSTCIFPFAYYSAPGSLANLMRSGSGSLLSHTSEVASDAVSWTILRLIIVAPLFALCERAAKVLRWLWVLVAILLMYASISPLVVFPHLGLLGLVGCSAAAVYVV